MIAIAIKGVPAEKANLQQIYGYFYRNFPPYSDPTNRTSIQSSIRHNLNSKLDKNGQKMFIRIDCDNCDTYMDTQLCMCPSRGSKWMINPKSKCSIIE